MQELGAWVLAPGPEDRGLPIPFLSAGWVETLAEAVFSRPFAGQANRTLPHPLLWPFLPPPTSGAARLPDLLRRGFCWVLPRKRGQWGPCLEMSPGGSLGLFAY